MARKDQRSTSFVRSWDTEVPVSRTAAAMEEMIRRYGASGYTRSEDYTAGRVVVAFTIAARDVRMFVDVPTVEQKLRAMPEFMQKRNAKPWDNRDPWARAQAERVAWRHLLLYVEASLNAVSAGLLTLEEAFFAYALIQAPDGDKQRAVDLVVAAETRIKQIAAKAEGSATLSECAPKSGAPDSPQSEDRE
jgi:hypothetical protein